MQSPNKKQIRKIGSKRASLDSTAEEDTNALISSESEIEENKNLSIKEKKVMYVKINIFSYVLCEISYIIYISTLFYGNILNKFITTFPNNVKLLFIGGEISLKNQLLRAQLNLFCLLSDFSQTFNYVI